MASNHTFTGTSTGLLVLTAGNWDNNTALANYDIANFTSLGTGSVIQAAGNTALCGITLNVKAGYTGSWGVESTGTNVAAPILIGAEASSGTNSAATNVTTLYLGQTEGGNNGNGSPLFMLGNGVGVASASNAATLHLRIYKTGTATHNYPPATFTGTNIRAWCYGGESGFAVRPGESCNLMVLHVAAQQGLTAPVVRLGRGCSLPAGTGTNAMNIEGGTVYTRSSATAALVTIADSTATYWVEPDCSGAHTLLKIREGGTVYYHGTGAISNTEVASNAKFIIRDGQPRSIGTFTARAGSTIDIDNGDASSFTGGVTINCPDGVGSITLKAPAGLAISIT